jgi:hypothetical protein
VDWNIMLIFVKHKHQRTMNVTEVTEKIKANPLFKDLILKEPSTDSQYGFIYVPLRHIKDGQKNELKLGGFYSLFVAHMYKDDEMKEFFYLSFYRKAEQRDFRRHSFHPIEYNKIFVTGDSVDEIISNFESKLIGYQLK